jgi:hypothetical protein
VFALGRLGAVDAENVNCAENEQICRYSNWLELLGRELSMHDVVGEEPNAFGFL